MLHQQRRLHQFRNQIIIINRKISFQPMAQNRKNWTEFEDKAIITLVKRYGTKNWAQISQKMSSKYGIDIRTGKQCRERWHNHLDPQVNKQEWSEKDEEIMFKAHQQYGNKWTLIAKLFERRSDNDVKNHFYSMLRRSLRRINKLLGKRNSTQKIKMIKPAVLSKLFAKQGQNTNEVSQQNKKIAQALFELSRAKTITNMSDSINNKDKRKFQELIQKLSQYNQEYELSQIRKRPSKQSQQTVIIQDEQKIKTKRNQTSVKSAKSNLRILRNHSSKEQSKKGAKSKSRTKKVQKRQTEEKRQVDSELKKQKQTSKGAFIQNKREQQQPQIEEQEINTGYMTRFKTKQSQKSFFLGEELNLAPDLFEISSFYDKKMSTSSNDSKKFTKNNNFFSFSPGFTPNSQTNPGYFTNLTPPNLGGRNWTPLCPSPNLSGIFSRLGNYEWKGNNQDLNMIVEQTRRNIEKQQIQ